jgi:hypothetical protein
METNTFQSTETTHKTENKELAEMILIKSKGLA